MILIILSGLGTGYYGYGLLLVLMFPGEYYDSFHKQQTPLLVAEAAIGLGLFLFFEIAILKNWIKKRRHVWPLFIAFLAVSFLSHVLFFELRKI